MKLIVFGSTGATGKLFLQQALENGHHVTAFVRTPAKMNMRHPNLTSITGDTLEPRAVKQAIQGHDAVISCLGSDGLKKSNVLSKSTQNIINAMKETGITRIAYIASAGIEKEIPGLTGIMASFILRNVLIDHRKAVEILELADVEWTVARPLRLVEGPTTGTYRAEASGVPKGGSKISRGDLAHFLLDAIEQNNHIRQSVGLAY